jgi:hypothetical protein
MTFSIGSCRDIGQANPYHRPTGASPRSDFRAVTTTITFAIALRCRLITDTGHSPARKAASSVRFSRVQIVADGRRWKATIGSAPGRKPSRVSSAGWA